ncbi:class I SAM-dependent methyltransferase [Streptomyces sp. TP-A0356]|uniref:class I SAM-dependent methyltransferase n=1 Tax=Streptomyces sp. TP-A0356 TaxID=1359208 RepID=UPI0006E39156|nr:class I SAM-dependent methyltransferase [Streptomyces sp. TP-A0356]
MKPLEDLAVYDDADFYDQEFTARTHDIPFFLGQAVRAGGPVLEVACGTGRITLPIARAGVEVTGLDIMPSMLARARQRAEDERLPVEWLEQDCRDIRSDRRFALVFSATNAMQHLHDLDSVVAFLASARNVLRPGGTLILDVFNPDMAKLCRVPESPYHHKSVADVDGAILDVRATTSYDAAAQVLRFTLDYLRDGACVRTKKVSMRCFFPEELLALCRLAGLDVAQRYGDYDQSPFTSTSPKQLLFCHSQSANGQIGDPPTVPVIHPS